MQSGRTVRLRIHWPWFIVFFCLTAMANTYLTRFQFVYPAMRQAGVLGLTLTLYLIGTGLSMSTVREVRARPLLQGLLLWIVVAIASLSLIWRGIVRL